jgi:uncharacterized membrane protein
MSIYLVAAYAVFWGFTFILVLSIWARQRRIERDLEAFDERLEKAQSMDD